jgi:uncharacterized OB-fold protein
MTSPEPVPLRTLDAQPYWDGCLRGELMVQRCTGCGAYQFYPRVRCVTCAGPVEFVAVSGKGTVHSLTVCHRPLTPRFGDGPYVVALVDLDEGPRLMTNIVGCPPESVYIGMKVTVAFQRLTEDVSMPVFGPVPS